MPFIKKDKLPKTAKTYKRGPSKVQPKKGGRFV